MELSGVYSYHFRQSDRYKVIDVAGWAGAPFMDEPGRTLNLEIMMACFEDQSICLA